MNKSKSKPKTKPCRAVELLEQGLKKELFEIWPMYPFREGKIKAYYSPGEGPRYGATSPLTDKQIADIENVIRCPLELSALRAFLEQNCNVTQLESLTWRDILRHFQRYYADNHKPGENPKVSLREYITKYTDVTDNFGADDDDNFGIVTSKITRIKKVDEAEKILPILANKPEKNQTRLYYKKDLDSVWLKLKDKIPTLPNLKNIC